MRIRFPKNTRWSLNFNLHIFSYQGDHYQKLKKNVTFIFTGPQSEIKKKRKEKEIRSVVCYAASVSQFMSLVQSCAVAVLMLLELIIINCNIYEFICNKYIYYIIDC
jgi:hypothetical protein